MGIPKGISIFESKFFFLEQYYSRFCMCPLNQPCSQRQGRRKKGQSIFYSTAIYIYITKNQMNWVLSYFLSRILVLLTFLVNFCKYKLIFPSCFDQTILNNMRIRHLHLKLKVSQCPLSIISILHYITLSFYLAFVYLSLSSGYLREVMTHP